MRLCPTVEFPKYRVAGVDGDVVRVEFQCLTVRLLAFFGEDLLLRYRPATTVKV